MKVETQANFYSIFYQVGMIDTESDIETNCMIGPKQLPIFSIF
jgi:hypothetical protein